MWRLANIEGVMFVAVVAVVGLQPRGSFQSIRYCPCGGFALVALSMKRLASKIASSLE